MDKGNQQTDRQTATILLLKYLTCQKAARSAQMANTWQLWKIEVARIASVYTPRQISG